MRVIVAVGLALTLSACATVTRGTSDSWTVNTTPSGAAVKTSNQFACDSTPCTFKMPRKSEFEVTVTKSGYKTWTGHVTHQVSGAGGAGMAGNVVLGGLIGAGVDVASGAMLNLVPNPLTIILEKLDAETVASAAAPRAVAAASAPEPAATKVVASSGKATSPKSGCIRVVTDSSQNAC